MARLARAEIFDPLEVSVFHCINRCVRRCFLCGHDPLTGRNYEHRKAWLQRRLAFLAGQFGIDVLGFAILSNHFHLVLRNRPDVVATWSDTQVAQRWLRLCPRRKTPDGQPAEPTESELDSIRRVPARLATIRRRLSDISWLMRMIAEPVARLANREDRVSGRFWQGRFKTVRLCDEAAVAACLAYVDLNPIRAGLAVTPEASDFTSVQRRIESLASSVGARADASTRADGAEFSPARCTGGSLASNVGAVTVADADAEGAEASPARCTADSSAEAAHCAVDSSAELARPDAWLAPIPLEEAETDPGPLPCGTGLRASDKGCLPMSLTEYLELVDWTGRQLVTGKSNMHGHLPPLLKRLGIEDSRSACESHSPSAVQPLLKRLGIEAENWLPLVRGFGRLFHRVAGAPRTLAGTRRWRRFHPGGTALLGAA